MNAAGLNKLYSISLRSKILFGFLFSIFPMLVIVVITTNSAREHTLANSHRQIGLISSAGQEQLDVLFQTGTDSFLEWTGEDVFGMAIEFGALDELKKHFGVLQKSRPEFYRLVIADIRGSVLEESVASLPNKNQPTSLKDTTIKEVGKISRTGRRTVIVTSDRDLSSKDKSTGNALLFCYRTEDSAGNHNGYFLAYMNLSGIHQVLDSIFTEMKRSGLASPRIAVMDTETEKVLESSGLILPGQPPVGPSLKTILHKSAPGEIQAYTTSGVTEHIVFLPLHVGSALSITTFNARTQDELVLLISEDEAEIMSVVRKTLIASILIGAIGLMALVAIGYFTIRSVTGPIRNLVNVLQRYGDGDTKVRAEVTSDDEIGYFSKEFNSMLEKINIGATDLQESEARYRMLFSSLQDAVNRKIYTFRFEDDSKDELAASLNTMLQSLESANKRASEEDWLKTGLTKLSDEISGENKLEDLCRKALTFVADYTGAQVGTVFVRRHNNKSDLVYELIASYAYKTRKELANRYSPGEGLIGQAALEKKVIHFTKIPEDYIRIESSLGMVAPNNIIVIPMLYEDQVMGIMELGATFRFNELHFNFTEQVGGMIAVAIHSAVANDRLILLLQQTENQSKILREQQEELQKANAELEEQTEILKQSESRLQVQQEELQASNEEMEEKNQLLEEQKRENEQSNRHLKQQQRELEEKAKQLELATKYKSEFLSNMSHELRTPLNSILLLAKMLADNDEENLTEDQIESAASIHRGGQTLLHLINDILDLSKIEAGRIELSIRTTRPKAIIKDFELEFKHIADSKGLDFIAELGEGVPETIETDVYRLEQVIRNLLGNAFKFTETGSVTLAIFQPTEHKDISRNDIDVEDCVAFSVIDTGPGVPREQLNQIFEAFKQVDGSISRRHGGTGLGLSISRELTSLLGGYIYVDSAPNKGAAFTIVIPKILKSGSPQKTPPRITPSVPAPPLNRTEKDPTPPVTAEKKDKTTDTEPEVPERETRLMLIIEDDREFSSILAGFFQKSGYETIVAPNGELGIKNAIEQRPTAIILDIGLPGIDGWTVLNELKNNPDTRHIPVHIMSAFDESREGLKQGAVGYLTKPVDIEGLQSALVKIEHVLVNPVKKLLVVEDEKDLRDSILKLMGTRDILTTTAETGHDALELLRSEKFDCMILDLGLPDISGFALLTEIEQDPSINKLPIIIYTGRDLSKEETGQLEQYSESIVLKSALSLERLLDETSLFMHRVEQNMPESQQRIIQQIREKDSSIKGKKVLLVDDDMRNAFALSKFLKGKGVDVEIADNGKKALEILENEQPPDIVLMDIMMPVMDGYEAIKKIRKRPKFKDLPVLALTAKAMETDREECIRAGANDYLSKPIDTQKLLSMLRIWMYQ